MADVITTFECPKCNCAVKVEIKSKFKFLLYRCPKCQSNVVFYDNKVDIISDKIISKLASKKKLRLFGFKAPIKRIKKEARKYPLDKDAVTNLKILLETEKDFDTFLSKL